MFICTVRANTLRLFSIIAVSIAVLCAVVLMIPEYTPDRPLRIAFIYDRNPTDSRWIYGHELGRNHLTDSFGPLVRTIAYEDCLIISASGCCGMARGGSGDVLSGIIGALMAEPSRRSPGLTAAIASELHGLAGEAAQQTYGERGMCAQDIINALPEVFKQYE